MKGEYQIITFYEFRRLSNIDELRSRLRGAMASGDIRGTIIIAEEGFNATVAGTPAHIKVFVSATELILNTKLRFKSSFHDGPPFKRVIVKVKSEIVTLKKPVNIDLGIGTHVGVNEWNKLLSDPSVIVLDTRNDYEFRNGTFRNAVNPVTASFSELPAFVAENLDPAKHEKVAIFCTGGIRCEKFAPYMKELGFKEVYQLEGGILRYLEEVSPEQSRWQGECFVFDERVTVDPQLKKGLGPDFSIGKNK